jgi:hypothetical protein
VTASQDAALDQPDATSVSPQHHSLTVKVLRRLVESTIGTTFTVVVVVRASPSCATALRTKKPNADGDIVFGSLPGGCHEAASVDVLKTSA